MPMQPATMRTAQTHTLLSDRINTTVRAKTLLTTGPDNRNKQRDMRTKYYKLIIIGIVGFLSLGGALVYFGYQNAIYPLDKAMGYLARAETAQTPETIADYLRPVKQLLPMEGNPVWSFPNPNTGLEDLHGSIKIIESNLEETTPYVYVSFTNILLGGLWVGVIMLVFAAMRRGRSKLEYETS